MLPSIIGLYVSSIICVFLFAFISFKTYLKLKKERYNIKNHFPYELNVDGYYRNNVYGNTIFILSGILLFVSNVLFIEGSTNGLRLAAGICAASSTVMFMFLYFTNLGYLRAHMIYYILFSTLSASAAVGSSILHINSYIDNKDNIIALLLGIVLAIVALIDLALVLNPKLSFNLKMDIDKSGEEAIYKRPKYFVLAFTEWVLYISLLILPISNIIFLTYK